MEIQYHRNINLEPKISENGGINFSNGYIMVSDFLV